MKASGRNNDNAFSTARNLNMCTKSETQSPHSFFNRTANSPAVARILSRGKIKTKTPKKTPAAARILSRGKIKTKTPKKQSYSNNDEIIT
jgi:hypothetical protein